ncbi:MAG: 50S ribosomal protein L9 [Planctomycetes bacterium]|jgi:large subunit ribosomal protein L9|nr:50S ribosomal protein L9 [Planctomycetota bacterium]MDP6424849.1 50S ribosomal protein L9 [Planctomycetota bacterium]
MARTKRQLEVLLLEDHGELGKAGDLVAVAPGYARNFLLPLRRAARPSKEALRLLEERRRRVVSDARDREAEVDALAEAIPATNVTLEMKASKEGHLYGSVTAQMIAEAMQRAGLDVVATQVRLETTIKEIGQFDVPVHVHGDLTVSARLWVVSQAE